MDNLVISNIKGGFGNQLFQFATALKIAMEYNSKLKFDLSFFSNDSYQVFYRLNRLKFQIQEATTAEIEYCKSRGKSKYRKVMQNWFPVGNFSGHIVDNPSLEPSNMVLRAKPPLYLEGWCTKLQYFDGIKAELQSIIDFTDLLSGYHKQIHSEVLSSQSVSLHIRRTDYIGSTVFKVMDISYYHEAIKQLKLCIENPRFFIFSDDIEWVKKNLNLPGAIIVDNENKPLFSDIVEFQLMRDCKHSIIANSSFSWWAGFLKKDSGLVTAPRVWHKDSFYRQSFEKFPFLPSDWSIID